MQIDSRESRLAAKLVTVGQRPCLGADAAPTVDRQNEGIEDAAELRLILLDMGGLLPQSEGNKIGLHMETRRFLWYTFRSRESCKSLLI